MSKSSGTTEKKPKKIKPNIRLAAFLVTLAIDDDIRAKLNQGISREKREAAIKKFAKNPLTKKDIKSLLDRQFDPLKDQLRVNQQNT